MGVAKYDIVSTDFDRNKSDQYELSILLGVDSFSYVVVNPVERLLLAFKSVALNTSGFTDWVPTFYRAIQADELLRTAAPKTACLSIHSERVCLVPQRLYTKGEESNYLARLTDISLDDQCRSEAIGETGIQLVYAIGEERLDAMVRRLAPRKIQHLGTILLSQWLAQSSKLQHKAIYLHLRDQLLTLAAIHTDQLLFYNVFKFQTAADVVYFVHLVLQQCGWSSARTPLYLCGELTKESEVYLQLYRFIEDMRFLTSTGVYELADAQLASLPSHLYCDLLGQLAGTMDAGFS